MLSEIKVRPLSEDQANKKAKANPEDGLMHSEQSRPEESHLHKVR